MTTTTMADRAGRGLRQLAAICAILVICAVSALMQWRFGYSYGRSGAAGNIWNGWTDAHVYGAAAVGIDALKALLPFFFMAALYNRMWLKAAFGVMLWVGAVVTAAAGATGHVALNRFDTVGARAGAMTAYGDLRAELKRDADKMGWVPAHRPIETVQAELNVHKAQRQWLLTRECSEVAGKSAREYCQQFHKLEAELASGVEAGRIQNRIDEVSGKLVAFRAAPSEADPQAGVISRVTGVEQGLVQAILTFLLAAVIEGFAGFGLYAVCGIGAVPARKIEEEPKVEQVPARSNILQFPFRERLRGLRLPERPAWLRWPDLARKAAVPSTGSAKKASGTPAPKATRTAASAPLPAPHTGHWERDQAYDDLYDMVIRRNGQFPSQKSLAKRWNRKKNTVTAWFQEWDSTGLFDRIKSGSFKQIRARKEVDGAIGAAA
jgi:type IV secretory pathway TrbD component